MRVLVTGGSGLVGKYVTKHLAQWHEVDILDVREPEAGPWKYHRLDVLNLHDILEAVAGYDAVVHLAGIPHPLDHPPETVYQVNTIGTFNVLEASARNGIRKFILMSSESTLGFAFCKTRMWPQYLPIDESHPLRPQDPYGLSKVSCELLCQGFTRAFSLQTVALRAPWIWVPEEKELTFYRQLIAEYRNWHKNLWSYVHVLDVCQAIELALRKPYSREHEAMFICADENWTNVESRQLAREFYPETKQLRDTFTDRASFISNAKAKSALGFQPAFTRRDLGL